MKKYSKINKQNKTRVSARGSAASGRWSVEIYSIFITQRGVGGPAGWGRRPSPSPSSYRTLNDRLQLRMMTTWGRVPTQASVGYRIEAFDISWMSNVFVFAIFRPLASSCFLRTHCDRAYYGMLSVRCSDCVPHGALMLHAVGGQQKCV